MNVEIITECERCHEKKLISVKDVGNLELRTIITRNSDYKYTSIFGDWMIVCPKCQEAYDGVVEKRKQEAKVFVEGS